MSLKKVITLLVGFFLIAVVFFSALLFYITITLPKVLSLEDYKPSLMSEVYDRNKKKFGEFFKEKRELISYEEIPEKFRQAFIASEDATFFKHKGVNFRAIFRAFIANIKKGRKAQGGSTITQQVAKSLFLSREKTYIRKLKEMFLSYEMEEKLTKEDILYLYLNQVYLGQGSYGVAMASQIYFRKPVAEMSLAEMALLAGLPQAPSRYSPLYNPGRAKTRQLYVLRRMAQENYISDAEAQLAAEEPIKVYKRKEFQAAGFFLETVRQILVKEIGEKTLLTGGVKIYTSLDLKNQVAAEKAVREGLRKVDKRQGFRGARMSVLSAEEVADFLFKTKEKIINDKQPWRILNADGSIDEIPPLDLQLTSSLSEYIAVGDIVDGVVTEVDDKLGLVYVRFAESRGVIDISTMEWARKPDASVYFYKETIKKPSQALKKGDIIQVKVVSKKFNLQWQVLKRAKKDKKTVKKFLASLINYAGLELEQEPQVEGALLSFDLASQEVLAMVGGYDFKRSKFNRSLQALRQTGSTFKAVVYTAALDKGLNPSTRIVDAPLIFEEKKELLAKEEVEGEEASEEVTTWRPKNHSKNFLGDILLRTALLRSLNVPTVKVIEKVGIEWVADYAKRLGVFNHLNMDLSMGLGSSSVTVYELNKVFSHLARMGQKIRPVFIHEVIDRQGEVIVQKISLDKQFQEKRAPIEEDFEFKRENFLKLSHYMEKNKELGQEGSEAKKLKQESGESEDLEEKENFFIVENEEGEKLDLRKLPPIFFKDPDQLIKKTTAYVITDLLRAAVFEQQGTGARARSLRRPVVGKTGSTSGYFDGWFAGYTPQVSTTVWVGYDEERSLGRGEVGGRNALPIWLDYMKEAHDELPKRDFAIPEGIVFANIDRKTGYLANAESQDIVRQAYEEGTEPQATAEDPNEESESNFLKDELTE